MYNILNYGTNCIDKFKIINNIYDVEIDLLEISRKNYYSNNLGLLPNDIVIKSPKHLIGTTHEE